MPARARGRPLARCSSRRSWCPSPNRMPSRSYRPRVRSLAPTLVLAAIWALLVAHVGPPRGDFANYYTSAALVLERAPLDRLYDYRWFTDQAARHGFPDRLVGF